MFPASILSEPADPCAADPPMTATSPALPSRAFAGDVRTVTLPVDDDSADCMTTVPEEAAGWLLEDVEAPDVIETPPPFEASRPCSPVGLDRPARMFTSAPFVLEESPASRMTVPARPLAESPVLMAMEPLCA